VLVNATNTQSSAHGNPSGVPQRACSVRKMSRPEMDVSGTPERANDLGRFETLGRAQLSG
jgi:hypothetical protein